MKTKQNVMKKLMLFTAAIAFCLAIVAKPVDVKAALAAPSGFQQSDYTSSSFEVEWQDNGADHYGLVYSADKVNWSKEVPAYNNYKYFGSLNAGTTYYVKIRSYSSDATNSYGNWSSILEVVTCPKYVTDVKWTGAGEQSVTASWTAPAGANVYKICISSDGYNEVFKGYAPSPSVTFSGLPKNSKIYIHVYAGRKTTTNKVALSSTDDYCYCYTAPTTPKTARVGNTSMNNSNPKKNILTYTWTPTSTYYNTDGYEIEVYQLKTNGKTKRIKKGSSNSFYRNYADVKSSSLFKYATRYRVRAYVTLDNGQKAYSAWSSYKNYVPQAKVKKLKAYSKTTGKLTWNKVTGAKNYTVYYKTSSKSSAKWKKLTTVKGTSATVKLNYYGRSYYYVKANKVKFGKKKLNSEAAKKAAYWSYYYF
nr:fibronectin type III domain-containing protein [Lachnospiraceae bacterium]